MHDYSAWIGRSEEAEDILSSAMLARLAALLDHGEPRWPPDEAPPYGHWLCFLPAAPHSELGEDGHPRRGKFLPPITLPRRMWAGGRLQFLSPVPVGVPLVRRSEIVSISEKAGSTGPLAFVTVRHKISVAGKCALVEEQDLVYRAAATPGSADIPPLRAERVPDEMRSITPDAVMLFRYSALTFNAHRIHYDRPYAERVESYPGLIVQAPYLATLMIDHYMRYAPGQTVTRFTFRVRQPLFDTGPFDLCLAWANGGAELWIRNDCGQIGITAKLESR